ADYRIGGDSRRRRDRGVAPAGSARRARRCDGGAPRRVKKALRGPRCGAEPTQGTHMLYSLLSASIGSTVVARHAGPMQAVMPASTNAAHTAANVVGSVGCVSKR